MVFTCLHHPLPEVQVHQSFFSKPSPKVNRSNRRTTMFSPNLRKNLAFKINLDSNNNKKKQRTANNSIWATVFSPVLQHTIYNWPRKLASTSEGGHVKIGWVPIGFLQWRQSTPNNISSTQLCFLCVIIRSVMMQKAHWEKKQLNPKTPKQDTNQKKGQQNKNTNTTTKKTVFGLFLVLSFVRACKKPNPTYLTHPPQPNPTQPNRATQPTQPNKQPKQPHWRSHQTPSSILLCKHNIIKSCWHAGFCI